jgi:hypothetical protein
MILLARPVPIAVGSKDASESLFATRRNSEVVDGPGLRLGETTKASVPESPM